MINDHVGMTQKWSIILLRARSTILTACPDNKSNTGTDAQTCKEWHYWLTGSACSITLPIFNIHTLCLTAAACCITLLWNYMHHNIANFIHLVFTCSIVVAASNEVDGFYHLSNYGDCVDLIAPVCTHTHNTHTTHTQHTHNTHTHTYLTTCHLLHGTGWGYSYYN